MWMAAALLLVAGAAADEFNHYLQSGIEETGRGEIGTAVADLQTALRLNPKSPEAYYRLGLLLGQIADFRASEAAFRHAIELKPDFAEAHYNLGLTEIANPRSKLDWPGAIAEFRAALQYRPTYAEAANYLGAGLMATGNLEGALTELEKATRLDLSLPEAHFNYGLALEQSNRLTEAESEYRRAVAAHGGTYPESSVALAKLLLHNGQPELARREVLAALRANPDLNGAHYTLGQIEQKAKNLAAAQIEIDQVRSFMERNTDAVQSARITNEGLQQAAKGEKTAALRSEREAVALKPDYGIPHYNLALILADANDWNGAAAEFVKAASLMPGIASPWFGLGRVLHKQGNLEDSFRALAWAARLAPGDTRIAQEMRAVQAEAQTASAGPMEHPPMGPKADTAGDHCSFAAQLAAAGDNLGAVGELLRALALDPGNDPARRNLAAAYARMKMTQRAMLENAKADLITRH